MSEATFIRERFAFAIAILLLLSPAMDRIPPVLEIGNVLCRFAYPRDSGRYENNRNGRNKRQSSSHRAD
jgi:hypothetical protein